MSELSITCPTCNGSGEMVTAWIPENGIGWTKTDCLICKRRGQIIPEHIIEAAARKMYAEVGTRNSTNPLTYDIAYPDEQADFLRVAKKMLWAGIEAAALEPAQ